MAAKEPKPFDINNDLTIYRLDEIKYFNAQPIVNSTITYFGRNGSMFYGYAECAYV